MSLSDEFSLQLRAANIEFVQEYRFMPKRKYRSDFAILAHRLLIECDGGQWKSNTGHNSGAGKERDCVKDCEAVLLGWRVMRFTTNMIRDGRALNYVERLVKNGY